MISADICIVRLLHPSRPASPLHSWKGQALAGRDGRTHVGPAVECLGASRPFLQSDVHEPAGPLALKLVPRSRPPWCQCTTALRVMAKTAVPISGPVLWAASMRPGI